LAIDDDEVILLSVKAALNLAGLENVELINNGIETLNKIKNGECFDIILLDLNMPEMDGIEVMRKLASIHYASALILFSGVDVRALKTAVNLAYSHNLNILGTLSKPPTKAAINTILANFKPKSSQPAFKPNYTTQAVISVGELKDAIINNDIELYFQPKVRVTDKNAFVNLP